MLRDELATVWLLPAATEAGVEDGVVALRFCRACAPSSRVVELACAYCGEGPLLAEQLVGAAADPVADPAVAGWLAGEGWELTPGLACPACRRVFERRSSR